MLVQHKVRWTAQKLTQRLALIEPLVHRRRQALPPFRHLALASPLDEPPVGPDVDDSDWPLIPPGSYWGKWELNFALRLQFKVPADWEAPVALHLPFDDARYFRHPETLVYIDGQPIAGADRFHSEITLPAWACDGQPHQLTVHGWTGRPDNPRDLRTQLYMRECALVEVDPPTRAFTAAARAMLGIALQLEDHNPNKGHLLNALDEAFLALDTRDPLSTPAFYESVPGALEALRAGKEHGTPLDVDIIAVGHAHIDVAWLWTLDQVVRKTGRTFSTVLHLMEEFPDYTFSQSQPQLYQFAERAYPEVFAQIKERVAEGRWEPMGGTWVEPDINAIGAESLVRQFLLGRGYFRKHFGDVDTPVLWLPDTFGYSWALPQLIKQAGMQYFVTHKMSWNQFNQMPNQLLWWQGMDGTRVLTHFLATPAADEFLPNATTYNGMVNAKEIMGTWTNFRQKEQYRELLTAYGYGDGGGGPTREMLQNIHEMADLPGAPRVRHGTVREYMENVEREIADELPVWNGEFYLEYHRGTYTSQARTKRHNRKSEYLLHDAEFLAALAALRTGHAYPHEDLRHAWELVCLNQFHDILPGSSIREVYEDSDRDYALVRELGERAREDALQALAAALPVETAVLVANPTSFGGARLGLLEGEMRGGLADGSGRALVTQPVEGGTLIALPDVPPYSVSGLRAIEARADAPKALTITQADGVTVLENPLVRVEIRDGDVQRMYDKTAGREVLSAPSALMAFEDRPMNFDAWDIDIYFEDRAEQVEGVESAVITEEGPLRAAVTITRTYRSSKIRQTISLRHDRKQLDFATWIDWHEQHTLLKAAFPVNILSPLATFDVQWGNVQRTTHRNTSWDWARFETCAHKWADLSEGDYGVALLNDCKYGYDIHGNVMRLSLLKSATAPDPQADQGEHWMTYSLLAHEGGWHAEVVPAAYDLNDPLILRRVSGDAGTVGGDASLVSVSSPSIVIETVKQAEDGNGIIVRLYEDQRSRGTATLQAGFALEKAIVCNLLEEDGEAVLVEGNAVRFDYTPYQILSLRLIPA
jgi:alpha-mannosidase